MSVNKHLARKIANRILKENQKGRSYRVIAREDYPVVKPGTLNRFANSKGVWIPQDECILIALGLKKQHQPKLPKSPIEKWVKPIRKKIAAMAKETRVSLGLQK